MNKKIIFLFILIIIGVLLLGKYQLGWFEKAPVLPVTEEEKPKVTVEYVPQGTLPKEIPTDIPLEDGAPMQRNEIVRAVDGSESQYVYRFYSQKTVAENFAIYEKYLKDNDWTVKNSFKDATSAFLLANKTDKTGNMQVTISKNSITGDVTVEINVVVLR